MDTVAVVDTDIFSSLFIAGPEKAAKAGKPVASWVDRLTGVRVVISFQTRAEVLSGVQTQDWGDRRRNDARAKLEATPTIPADADVIDAYATLSALSRRAGHPLHQSFHAADRWVAACAIAKDLPVFSGDTVYAGAPGVRLLGD